MSSWKSILIELSDFPFSNEQRILFSPFFCVACVGVHTYICARVCAPEGQRSSVNLELTDWLDWLVRESPRSPISTPQHWNYRHSLPCPSFYMGWRWVLGPSCCVTVPRALLFSRDMGKWLRPDCERTCPAILTTRAWSLESKRERESRLLKVDLWPLHTCPGTPVHACTIIVLKRYCLWVAPHSGRNHAGRKP